MAKYKKFKTKRISWLSLPLIIRWLKLFILSQVDKDRAASYANKLFTFPRKYKLKDWENSIRATADKCEKLPFNGIDLSIYEWGSGPIILLVHGWEGRSMQLAEVISPLTALGYKVVAVDFPAHGDSGGEATNIVDFKDVILRLVGVFGEIDTVIAHSYGAVATAYALDCGMEVNKLVLFCPPPSPKQVTIRYARYLKIDEEVITKMLDKQQQIQGVSWDKLSLYTTAKRVDCPVLLLYDNNDDEVAMADAEKIHKLFINSELIKTTGLGHYKILRDDRLIDSISAFIQK